MQGSSATPAHASSAKKNAFINGEENVQDLRKAAEMALEALSEYTGVVTSGTDPTKWDEVVDGGGPAREAIQALRQALEKNERVNEITRQFVGVNEDGSERWVETEYRTVIRSEWVGLTDDEIYDYADKFLYQHGSNYGIQSFGKAIEAKLKEKNA
jgi:hypothetical protein